MRENSLVRLEEKLQSLEAKLNASMGEHLSHLLDFDHWNAANKITFELGWLNLFKFGPLRFGVKWQGKRIWGNQVQIHHQN